jgi:hypothetical protein
MENQRHSEITEFPKSINVYQKENQNLHLLPTPTPPSQFSFFLHQGPFGTQAIHVM